MRPEGFPDLPLDPVTVDGPVSEPFCDYHPEPGKLPRVIAHQGPQRSHANAQPRVLEHLVELYLATQAAVVGETHR